MTSDQASPRASAPPPDSPRPHVGGALEARTIAVPAFAGFAQSLVDAVGPLHPGRGGGLEKRELDSAELVFRRRR